MKKIHFKRVSTALLSILLLLSLFGCATQPESTVPASSTAWTAEGNEETVSTAPTQTVTQPEGTVPEETDQPTQAPQQDPQPTEPSATLPQETVPQTTAPAATQPEETLPEATQPTQPQPTEPPASTGLQVHFIDVGQADAALLLCDGKTMLIDGGNAGDSNLIYSYLKRLEIKHLDYIVCSHAHEDHVGGLSGALNYATVGTVYAPVTSYSSTVFSNFVKNVNKQNKAITVPTVGTTFSLGGANCKVLAVNTTSDTNNSSIVLRVTYGSTSFLFTGDAERDVEDWLVNSGQNVKSTVLKVGHHGSSTSTGYLFLRTVAPQYAVISAGKGNSYGHPHDEVMSRLRDADVTLYRTDMHGDVVCYSNGSTLSFTTAKKPVSDIFGDIGNNSTGTIQPSQPEATGPEESLTQPEQSKTVTYVVNTNSRKFHEETCQHADRISSQNRWDFTGTREELIEQGYVPCKVCNP